MTLPRVDNAQYPTPDEVLAQLLTDIKYAYDRIGVTVNVSRGSELYERMKVISNQVSVAINNNELALADVSPLDADGEALEEIASTYGVTRRAATASAGLVIISTTDGGSVAIPDEFVATSVDGIKYETTGAGVYNDGNYVEIIAQSAGIDTTQDAGKIITWDSAAIGNLTQTATVADGGLTGGADADDDETLRRRLLIRLSSPAIGGNAAHVADIAELANTAVERAYVYSALRGPGSYDVSIVKAGGDRTLSSSTVNLVANSLIGQMPGHADLNITSVLEQELDVVIDAGLPLPVTAGGAGSGWKDNVPWPSDADSAFATVTAVGVDTITVDSTSADTPIAGKRFAIWDYVNQQMHEFSIANSGVSGGSGAYVLALSAGSLPSLSFVEVGMYVSAAAENLNEYALDFVEAVGALGPGEKTTDVDRLPRAARIPRPDVEAPAELTNVQLTAVINDNAEILNLEYATRFETGTTTARSVPDVPANISNAPRIITIKHLSFRRKV